MSDLMNFAIWWMISSENRERPSSKRAQTYVLNLNLYDADKPRPGGGLGHFRHSRVGWGEGEDKMTSV